MFCTVLTVRDVNYFHFIVVILVETVVATKSHVCEYIFRIT